MLPVARDWGVELKPPTNWYQRCLPEVFRHLNLVTDTDAEVNAIFNNTRPETTDQWETTHSQAMTGEWDNGKTLFKDAGFINFISAEGIAEQNGQKKFDNAFGYFDEGIHMKWLGLIGRGPGVLLEIC